MQTRYLYLLKYVLPLTDLLMVNGVYYFTYTLMGFWDRDVSSELHWHYIVVCNLIWVISAAYFKLYSEYGARRTERIYRGTWKSVVLHLVLFSVYLFFLKQNDFSRLFILVFYGVLSFMFILNRFVGTSFQLFLFNSFSVVKPVAILGNTQTGIHLASYFEKQSYIDFYGFLDEDEDDYLDTNGFLSSIIKEQFRSVAEKGINDIYVIIAPERMKDVKLLTEEADKQCIRLKFVPDIGAALSSSYNVSYLGNEFPVISLRTEPLESINNRFKKRVIDVLFSGAVILFVLSWLYPILAVLIKIQSRGPVLFKQLRSGRDDEPFWCYKFRSMRLNDESDNRQASKYDDRITPIGRFLRTSSLDELPQFFNVFIGQMSVVGPRPHMLSHTEEYKEKIDQFMVRHFLKPGITGWAQVNGFRGETKENYKMEKRVEHDLWYMENWTAMLDIRIIFMTIFNMIKGEENAY